MSGFPIVTLEPEPFAFLTRVCATREVGDTVSETFASLSSAFAAAGARPQGPPLAHFRPVEDDCVSVDLGFPVAPDNLEALLGAGLSVGETCAGQAMCAEHDGGYGDLSSTYDKMISAIRDAGMQPAPDMWERYGGEGEAVRVEVIWPVLF